MDREEINDLAFSSGYDVLGLVGIANEFTEILKRKGAVRWRSPDKENSTTILAFESDSSVDAKQYLKISDAVVFCLAAKESTLLVPFHLFSSLTIPSMLNIDLADLRKIAKGIGLSFNDSDNDSEKLIARLPKACFVAKAALLHFSCKDDVKLKEIYDVSRAIALKRAGSAQEEQINNISPSEVKKLVRKVNIKMGIRMVDQATFDVDRISLTAVLFGI
jgi:cell division GTPase FtsZ